MKRTQSYLASLAGGLPPIFALALLLPGCSLDRRPIITMGTYYQYQASATIRSDDGVETTVAYGDMTLDRLLTSMTEASLLEQGGSLEATDAAADGWWRRYLNNRLQQGLRDALREGRTDFQMRFGNGPGWCLVAEPSVERVGGPLTGVARDPALSSPDPLPLCPPSMPPPPPPGCELVPGSVPQLDVATSVDFGLVPVGTDSGPRPTVLQNVGTGRLCLNVMGPSGPNPDDFTRESVDDCRMDTTDELAAGRVFVEAGESCTLQLHFVPTNPGARRANMDLDTNDPAGRLRQIVLTGTGQGGRLVVASGAPPLCAPLGADRCYGRRVEVRNEGPGHVRIGSWGGDGVWSAGMYVPFEPGPTSPPLAPGGTHSAWVSACMLSMGGSLSVASNADNPTLTISVIGQEVCP